MKQLLALAFLFCTLAVQSQETIPRGFNKAPAMSITGDFNGDGTPDTFAQFVADSTGRRVTKIAGQDTWDDTLKYYDIQGYANAFTLNGKPTDTDNYVAVGLYCLINLGNINAAEGDEIALVPLLKDYSNINTCHIYSLCNGKWVEVFSFTVNEMAFSWTRDKQPVFKTIPGALEKRNGQWRFYDYTDDSYQTEEEATAMSPLVVANCK